MLTRLIELFKVSLLIDCRLLNDSSVETCVILVGRGVFIGFAVRADYSGSPYTGLPLRASPAACG